MPDGSLEPVTDLAFDAPAERQRQFADALRLIRSRSAPTAQVTERRMALVGALLLSAGVVLVVLGWYGAAHTSRLYLQIPYLISGGLLGVVVAFAGGFVFFASWLTRLVHDQHDHQQAAAESSADIVATLGRIEALLQAQVDAAGAAPSGDAGIDGAGPDAAVRRIRSRRA